MEKQQYNNLERSAYARSPQATFSFLQWLEGVAYNTTSSHARRAFCNLNITSNISFFDVFDRECLY